MNAKSLRKLDPYGNLDQYCQSKAGIVASSSHCSSGIVPSTYCASNTSYSTVPSTYCASNTSYSTVPSTYCASNTSYSTVPSSYASFGSNLPAPKLPPRNVKIEDPPVKLPSIFTNIIGKIKKNDVGSFALTTANLTDRHQFWNLCSEFVIPEKVFSMRTTIVGIADAGNKCSINALLLMVFQFFNLVGLSDHYENWLNNQKMTMRQLVENLVGKVEMSELLNHSNGLMSCVNTTMRLFNIIIDEIAQLTSFIGEIPFAMMSVNSEGKVLQTTSNRGKYLFVCVNGNDGSADNHFYYVELTSIFDLNGDVILSEDDTRSFYESAMRSDEPIVSEPHADEFVVPDLRHDEFVAPDLHHDEFEEKNDFYSSSFFFNNMQFDPFMDAIFRKMKEEAEANQKSIIRR